MERLAGHVMDLCRKNNVREIRVAKTEEERDQLWAGRRGAFGSLARLSPNYFILDGTVPRTKLPEVLREVMNIAERHNLQVANVFHAGDGNLHPCLLYDDRNEEQRKATREAGFEILQLCAESGGTLSGEHGIGVEKQKAMPLIFNNDDLAAMRAITDVFDPNGLCNPGKIFPSEEPSDEPN
jgi:FAD/FMN-containing dehydrogenase